jgi:hypothetical protein
MPTIEKDVPLPPLRKSKAPGADWAFKYLEPGESVFYAGADHKSSCAGILRMHAHRTGKKFTARQQNGGLRIWRIS